MDMRRPYRPCQPSAGWWPSNPARGLMLAAGIVALLVEVAVGVFLVLGFAS